MPNLTYLWGNTITNRSPTPGGNSTGGPFHLATAEDVEVEVIDGLAAVGTVVNHDAIAVFESDLGGDSLGGQEQMSEEGMVLGFGVGKLGNQLFGNNEDMNWSLGVNIFEGEA